MTSAARELALVGDRAAACQACDLYRRATQTVFGEGPIHARLMLVGEQPGDQEDRQGEPFVGPAGRILDDAIARAGLAREQLYVTNAVKHFKWTPRGKRRIHQKPNRTEVVACRQWLGAELAMVAPATIVALGATAGQALLGPSFRVGASRGAVLELDGTPLVPTIHPSAILRLREREERATAFEDFVADLVRADQVAGGAAGFGAAG